MSKYERCLGHFGMSMHYFSLNSMDLVQTWIVIGTFAGRNSTIKPKKANPESKGDVMKPTWCHKHSTRVALHHKPQRGPCGQPCLPKTQQQLHRNSRMNTKYRQRPAYSVSLNLKVKSLSRVWLFATPWTVAHQARPSMEFSRQEYWSGLLFPFPGDFPDPGIKPGSPALQADALLSEPLGKTLIWMMQKRKQKQSHVGICCTNDPITGKMPS